MLWVCLRFPKLAVEVFERGGASGKPLIVTNDGNRPVVIAANQLAIQPGLATRHF